MPVGLFLAWNPSCAPPLTRGRWRKKNDADNDDDGDDDDDDDDY